jgi:PAS domain S-box-containing protein
MKKTRVLIVEDSKVESNMIKKNLITFGHTVLKVVTNGEQAIESARELNPDIVLMDILLEGKMDGIDAAKQIHDQFKVPIVYLTGYSEKKFLDRAKTTQPFGYLIKPINEKELYAAIEVALYKSKLEEAHEKEFEEQKKTLEERDTDLKLIVESADDIIVTQDRSGQYLYYNGSPKFNIKSGDVIGKTPHDFFDKQTADKMRERVDRVFETGESINEETMVNWKGETIWYNDTLNPMKDEEGSVFAVVTISRNITKLKEAEDELKKKIVELEKWQKVTVGRELKMAELKKEIDELKKRTRK